jgi:exopolysaccharide production protein ExoZ
MYRSLQAGRAAAALLVCVYHVMGCVSAPKYFNLPWAAAPFSWGVLAVEYFFALSGFILYTVHQADLFRPERFVPYAVKRIIRIYPTYLIIALGVLIPALLIPALRNTVAHEPITIVSRLLLFPEKFQDPPADGSLAYILTVAWSLEYEVLFYVLFGLVLLGRTWAVVIVGVLACGYGAHLLGIPLPKFGRVLAGRETLTFVAGMVAAAVHRTGFRVSRPGWVSLVAVVGLFVLHGDSTRILIASDLVRAIPSSLCAALLILSLIAGEERGMAVGRHPWIQLLGNASYALYLIHFPLVSAMTKAAVAAGMPRFGVLGAAATVLVEVAVSVAAGVGFHVWIELPILGWLRERTRFLTELPAAAQPGV